MSNFHEKTLAEVLAEAGKPGLGIWKHFKSESKERLVKLAVYKNVQANAAAVDTLLKESKKLYDSGKRKQAQSLLDVAGEIIQNNKELQKTVGDVLNNT